MQYRFARDLVDLEADAITQAFPDWRFSFEWLLDGTLLVNYDADMTTTAVRKLRRFIDQMVPKPKYRLERMPF